VAAALAAAAPAPGRQHAKEIAPTDFCSGAIVYVRQRRTLRAAAGFPTRLLINR
jgi:hypothetical protein